jgi:hypothetical protein
MELGVIHTASACRTSGMGTAREGVIAMSEVDCHLLLLCPVTHDLKPFPKEPIF